MRMRFRTLYIVMFVIMVCLTVVSTFVSHVFPSDYYERILVERDSLLSHLVVLLVVMGCLGILHYKILTNKQWERANLFLLPISLFVIGMIAVYWAIQCNYIPLWDPGYVCRAAEAVAQGREISATEVAYINRYPQQVGIVWLFSIVIRLFGTGGESYMTLHLFLAFCVPLILWNGYLLTDVLFENKELNAYYLIMGMGMLPLAFYVNFVYSDIPGILLLMMAVNATLYYGKTAKKRYYMLAVLLFVLAIMIRMNNLIVGIAVIGIWCLFALMKRAPIQAGRMVLAVALVWIGVRVMSRWLEGQYGIDSQMAEPSIAWIAMGMQRSEHGAGWFNGYLDNIYASTGGNASLIKEDSILQIKRSMMNFLRQPKACMLFYAEKFLLQWNQPSYQCLGVAESYEVMPTGVVEAIYRGNLFSCTRNYFDCYQWVVYIGFACYLWCRVRGKEYEVNELILVLAIFGGMLFSLLWEAKSRYVLPYFILMIPYSVRGWVWLIDAGRKNKE